MSIAASMKRLRKKTQGLTPEPITIRMDPLMVKKVGKICDQYGITRSELLRELIELGYDRFVDGVGVE